MACDDVLAALAEFNICRETQDGSCVTTHCVYPSFDPVEVYVTRFGEGFIVHDGGGAQRSMWMHGRDEALESKVLKRWANRYKLSLSDSSTLQCSVQSASWLTSAIIAIANASAGAANEAIEHIATATEFALKDRLNHVLTDLTPKQSLARDYEVRGNSGKVHSFDFAIHRTDGFVLLDAVAPHHVSISSKYVAFSDVGGHGAGGSKYAVYDRDLDIGDSALLQQVAELVPFTAIRTLFSRVPHNGRSKH